MEPGRRPRGRSRGSRLFSCGMRLSGRGTRLSSCGTRLLGRGTRLPSCGMRLSGCGMRLPSCGMRLPSCGMHHPGCGTRLPDREPAPVDTVRVFVDQDKLPSTSTFDRLLLRPFGSRYYLSADERRFRLVVFNLRTSASSVNSTLFPVSLSLKRSQFAVVNGDNDVEFRAAIEIGECNSSSVPRDNKAGSVGP